MRFLLVGGGLLVALGSGEILLRVARPQIFPLHPPGLYIEDPTLGYAPAPGFEGFVTRAEFRAPVSIGASGLRGADPRPHLPNTFRILVLGDSQAWGFGVGDHETLSAQLEALLTEAFPALDVQVLNGGVPGYGTADELAYLQSRGPALQPDLVVVQFLSINDLRESRSPASTWAMVRDGMLTLRSPGAADGAVASLPLWERGRLWLKRHSHLATLIFDSLGYLGMRAGLLGGVEALWGEDFTAEEARLGEDLLVQIVDEALGMGARTLLLYTTGQAQVVQATDGSLPSAGVVRRAAERTGAPWIDLTKQFRQRPDRTSLYYRKDGHWTAQGHRAVAEILFAEIVDRQLVPESAAGPLDGEPTRLK